MNDDVKQSLRRVASASGVDTNLMRQLLDVTPTMVWATDRDGGAFYLNSAWRTFTGVSDSTHLGPGWRDALHPEDMAHVNRTTERAFSHAHNFELECRIRHHSGHYSWCTVNGVPWYSSDGELGGYIGACVEIDDQKRRQTALTALQEKYEAAVAASTHGLWDWDIETNSGWVSDSCREMLGYTPGDVFPNPADFVADHIHPADQPYVATAIREHVIHDLPYDIEYRLRQKSGEYRWYRGRGAAQRDDSGRAVRMSGSVIDINLRKQAEIAAFHEREKVEATLASIDEAVLTVDALGHVDFLNESAERLLCVSLNKVRGRPAADFMTLMCEDRDEPLMSFEGARLMSVLPYKTGDDAMLVPTGQKGFAVELTASPIQRQHGELHGAVIVFKDVTDQRRHSREISYHASHDALTELVNRREFERRVARTLETLQSQDDQHALCFLDLDQFKAINDGSGHIAGDAALREIAGILRRHTRARDTVARLGGDEFGLLMEHCSIEQAQRVTGVLQRALAEHQFEWDGERYGVGVSVGIVALDRSCDSVTTALARADQACYDAKADGRNRIHLFDSQDMSEAG